MDDDFSSPMVIANLFEGVRLINSVNDKKEFLSADDLTLLKQTFETFVYDILGLKSELSGDNSEYIKGLMELVLEIRQSSRAKKDWGTSDKIRDGLAALKITVKDGKDGSNWELGK